MGRNHKPRLVLFVEHINDLWRILYGLLFIGVGIYAAILGKTQDDRGELSIQLMGLGIGAVGVVIIGVALANLKHPRPVFVADSSGFRIRRWRKRPWGAFHGVRVVDRHSKGSKIGEVVHVQVRKSGLFRYQTVAFVGQSGEGYEIAQRITSFRAELDEIWAEEDARFDAGAAPVVAMRQRQLRETAPEFSMRDWLRGLTGGLRRQ